MGWQRPLAYPIKLRDGHVIETMAQAAGLMTQGPRSGGRSSLCGTDSRQYVPNLMRNRRQASMTSRYL